MQLLINITADTAQSLTDRIKSAEIDFWQAVQECKTIPGEQVVCGPNVNGKWPDVVARFDPLPRVDFADNRMQYGEKY